MFNRDVWKKPKKISEYTDTRNNYCNICFELVTFCPSIDACCTYCNVVNHIACLDESERNVVRGGWVCSDCIDDMRDSKETFLNKKLKDAFIVQRDNAQKMIAKHVRR